MDAERALAEAFDGRENVVGRLGPAERSGIAVMAFDVALNGGLEVGGGAMCAALDLALGKQREEALDLIEP